MFSAITNAISSVMPSASTEASPSDEPVSTPTNDDQPKETSPAVPTESTTKDDTATTPAEPPKVASKARSKSKAKRAPRRPARRGGGSEASSADGDSDDASSASSDGEEASDSGSEDEEDVEEDGRSAGDKEEEPQRSMPDDSGLPPASSTSPKEKLPPTKTVPSTTTTAKPAAKPLFPSSGTLMDALDDTAASDLEEVNFDEFERNGVGALKGKKCGNGKMAGGGSGGGTGGLRGAITPATPGGAPQTQIGGGKGKAIAGPGNSASSATPSSSAPTKSKPSAPSTNIAGSSIPTDEAINAKHQALAEKREKALLEKRAKMKEKQKAKKALKAAATKEERLKAVGGGAAKGGQPAAAAMAGQSESAPDSSEVKDVQDTKVTSDDVPGSSAPEDTAQIESTPNETDDTTSVGAEAADPSPSDNINNPTPLPGTSGVGGRLNNRQAYQNRVAADPSFVPRVGKFWTHDQRHYAPGTFGSGGSEYSGLREMSDYWRGQRGGRGGFRGRGGPGFGRGGPGGPGGMVPGGRGGRGGFVHGPPPHLPQHSEEQQQQQSSGSKVQASAAESMAVEAPSDPTILAIAEPSQTSSPAEVEETRPRKKGDWAGDAGRSDINSWNHDGYEEMAAQERKREEMGAVRGAHRGRGRGGRGGPPRGGFAGQHPRGGGMVGGPNGGYIGGMPGQFTAVDAIRVKLPGSTSGEAVITEVIGSTSVEDAQDVFKVSEDRKLGEVVVRLPRTPSIFSPAQESTETSAPLDNDQSQAEPVFAAVDATAPVTETAISPDASRTGVDTPEPSYLAANLQLQAEFAALREQQEIMRRKEVHIQEEMHRLELERRRVSSAVNNASESGSVGSGPGSAVFGNSFGTPDSYLPPGVGMTNTGQFYELATGQPVVFVPDPVPGPSSASGFAAPTSAMSPAHGQQQAQQSYARQQQQHSYYSPPSSQSPTFHANAIPPHLQQRAPSAGYSAYSNGYNGNTPMTSPYAGTPPANLGYFVPPRTGSKIQIRAPDASEEGKSSTKQPEYSPYPRSNNNPYANQQQQGHVNGQQMQGGRAYYPQQQHQQQAYYGQQGGGSNYEQAAYGEFGYGGEYGGYQ